MTRTDKIKVLQENGWHQWYSQTHYVHENIFEFLEKMKKFYWRSDYTNWQYSVDEAYEIYLKCQK